MHPHESYHFLKYENCVLYHAFMDVDSRNQTAQ